MFNCSIRTDKSKNPTWDDPLAPSDTAACPGLPSAQRHSGKFGYFFSLFYPEPTNVYRYPTGSP